MESFPFHLCSLSNIFEKQITIEPPASQPLQYIQSVKKVVIKYQIDIILPLYEELFYLSLYKPELESHCKIFLSDIELLEEFHNKYTFIEMIKKLSLPIPETLQVICKDEALVQIKKPHPVVMKPTYSRFGNEVILYPRPHDLEYIEIHSSRPWVIQEHIVGKHYCVYALAHNGKLLALAIYPQEMVGMNMCVNFVHEYHSGIQEWVERVINHSHFSGQMSFDLIIDTHDTIYPIEANPRVTSGIHLLINNPAFIEQLLNPQPTTLIQPNDHSRTMYGIFVVQQLFMFWKDFKRNLHRFAKSRDVVFSWKDPLPAFIGQFIFGAYLLMKGIINGKTFNDISLLDIKWNGK